MFRKQLCIGVNACGKCMELCKKQGENLFEVDSEGKCNLNMKYRSKCFTYSAVCPTGAIHHVGKDWEIDKLLDIAEKDCAFYGEDGGITLSGGEPLMQSNAVTLLKRAKEERYMQTAIETCGEVPTERLLEAARYLDQIFLDIKSVDDQKHQEYTGKSGIHIRENLNRLAQVYPQEKITVRTPVIPGFNDKAEELAAIENFLSKYPYIRWQKLPYHTYGVGKYEMLGRKYPLRILETQNAQSLKIVD